MSKAIGIAHTYMASIMHQTVRISSTIAAEWATVSVIQSDFKDGRSAENCRWEMKGGGRIRKGGLEEKREEIEWGEELISPKRHILHPSEITASPSMQICTITATWYFRHVTGILSLNLRLWLESQYNQLQSCKRISPIIFVVLNNTFISLHCEGGCGLTEQLIPTLNTYKSLKTSQRILGTVLICIS